MYSTDTTSSVHIDSEESSTLRSIFNDDMALNINMAVARDTVPSVVGGKWILEPVKHFSLITSAGSTGQSLALFSIRLDMAREHHRAA